ncbi:hypothetical protein DRQ50_06695 [bacterium]|nr:MAG: hypothetical protein DRQ50_06695 [bacterium]
MSHDRGVSTTRYRSRYHLCFVDSLRTWGGAEVWLLETTLALRHRGHEVSIVAAPDGELLRRARLAGVPVAAIPIRFDAAPWTLLRLWRHFRRQGVTAVVANRTKDLKACAVACRPAGVPIVLNTRESDFPLKNKFYYRWYFRHGATGLVVASEATRRTLLNSAPWLDAERIHLLYKGIDTGCFRPAPSAPDTPVAGFVGQLITRKGIPELMAAWSLLDAEVWHPRPRLILAGEGPLKPELERWRAGLQHPDTVDLAGFVEDPAAFYRGLSTLVMPSHAEGFGLAAAEALACGVPVIAGDASSLPEIVTDGISGRLVPAGDPDSLACALRDMLGDLPRARAWGATGRRHVLERFPREVTLDRLLALTGHERNSS